MARHNGDQIIGKKGRITNAHIKAGVCGDPERCALSLAVADMFGVEPEGVEVDIRAVQIWGKDLWLKVSDKLWWWVHNFDDGEPMDAVDLVINYDATHEYLLDLA